MFYFAVSSVYSSAHTLL